MTELHLAWIWMRTRIDERLGARFHTARRSEAGFTAVEWTLILLAVIAMAGFAYAAAQSFLADKTGNLK